MEFIIDFLFDLQINANNISSVDNIINTADAAISCVYFFEITKDNIHLIF